MCSPRADGTGRLAFALTLCFCARIAFRSFSMNMSTGERFVRIDIDAVGFMPEPATKASTVPPDWRMRLPAKEGVVRLQLLPGTVKEQVQEDEAAAEEAEEEEEEEWEQPAISIEEHIDILRLLRSLCRASPKYLGAWSDAGGARSLLLLVKPPLTGLACPALVPQLKFELILGLRGLSAFVAYSARQQPASQQRAAVCTLSTFPSISQFCVGSNTRCLLCDLQEVSPLEKWLDPEICTCLCLEMCKIVASEAPGIPLRCQAEVRTRLRMPLRHPITVYHLGCTTQRQFTRMFASTICKTERVLVLLCGLFLCDEGLANGFD